MDEIIRQYSKVIITSIIVVFIIGVFFMKKTVVSGIGSLFDTSAKESSIVEDENTTLFAEASKNKPTVEAIILDAGKYYEISEVFSGVDYKGDEAAVYLEEGFDIFFSTGRIFFEKPGQYPVKVRVIDSDGRTAIYEMDLYVNEEIL